MATFTLGTASQATGMAKSSILRAIKTGRLSATRDNALGQWSIDPVELGRVFPLLAIPGAPEPQPRNEHDAMADVLVAELRATISDLRRDRDHWRESNERAQIALAEAQRHMLPPPATPVEQPAPEPQPQIEQPAPPAAAIEQAASPVEPPKRRWWRWAAI